MEKNKKLNYLRYILTFILLLSFIVGPVALNSYKNSQSLAKDSSENYKHLLLEAQNSNYENDLEELYNIGRRIRNMIWKIESDMEYEEDHIKYSKLNLMLMGLKNTMDIIDLKAAELKKNFITKQTNKKIEDKNLVKAPLLEENELTSKFRFLRQLSKTKKEKEKEVIFVSNNTAPAGKKSEVSPEEDIEDEPLEEDILKESEDDRLSEEDELLDDEEIQEEVEDEEEDVSFDEEELDMEQEESEENIDSEEDNIEDKEVDEDKENELEEDLDEINEEVISEDNETDEDLKNKLDKEDNKNKIDNKSEDTSTKLNIYIDNKDEKINNNRG